MEQVIGLGGFFLRAKDHEGLAKWYADNLGLAVDPSWHGAVLPCLSPDDHGGAFSVWTAFPNDTDYFGSRENAAMVNFRVRDLHAMLAQLRANGVDVDDKVDESDFGKFGWLTDPEGNRVELWEAPQTMPEG